MKDKPGDSIEIQINGTAVSVRAGSSVAAALLTADAPCRISVSGQPRSALCAMGICMECRATVDGVPHVRTCLVQVRPGMKVATQ